MELEDDQFFAELSKQIALLIMDDDEQDVKTPCVSVTSQASHPTLCASFLSEPTCGRESKGTGVFIPKSSLPRKKNKQGKHTSLNSKTCKHPDRPKTASHTTCRNDPSGNSFSSKQR